MWCLKRFCEGLKGLHKTFCGTTNKCEKKKFNLIFSLSPGLGRKGLISKAKFGDYLLRNSVSGIHNIFEAVKKCVKKPDLDALETYLELSRTSMMEPFCKNNVRLDSK